MIWTRAIKLASLFLVLVLSGHALAQEQAERGVKARLEKCESICLFVEPVNVNISEKNRIPGQVAKVDAYLVNNTNENIEVRASGDDWLFYEVMSDLDTVKKRYSCHVCYYRKVESKSEVRFEIYADDIKDIFAIRLRYRYEWETEEGDKLIHYVSWISAGPGSFNTEGRLNNN